MPEQCQGSYVCIVNVNNNLGYYITSADDFSHTLIGEVRNNITLNSKITLGQYTRVLFMNIPKSKDGALLAIAPGDKIITAFRNNGVWEENSSHFIATKSDLDASVKTTNLSAGKDVRLFVGELNGSQNYLQFLIDGVDKGYIVFDVSRNINT